MRESVLLRTLGAGGKQILKITSLEYLFLGAIGSLMGVFLSLLATQLLALGVFELSFVPSLIPFLFVDELSAGFFDRGAGHLCDGVADRSGEFAFCDSKPAAGSPAKRGRLTLRKPEMYPDGMPWEV